jgi:hypothetical protein
MRLKYVFFVVATASAPFVVIDEAHAGLGCWNGSDAYCEIDTTSCAAGTCDGVCASDGAGGAYCLDRACELCLPAGETCDQALDSILLRQLGVQGMAPVTQTGVCSFTTDCGLLEVGLNQSGSEAPWVTSDFCYLDGATHMTPLLWGEGDCDGDLLPNDSDPSACLLVLGRMGNALNTTVLRRHRVPCSASGARRVGRDGVCANDGIAIACNPSVGLECPQEGACAFDPDLVLGLCTYREPPAAPIVAPTLCLENMGCIASVRADAYAAWSDGDCDSDMRANDVDPDICLVAAPTPTSDAGPALDAARRDAGAIPEGTTFTGGGGIVCSASSGREGRASGLGWAALSLLALVVTRRNFLVR